MSGWWRRALGAPRHHPARVAAMLIVLAVTGVVCDGCARRSLVIPVSRDSGRQSTLVPRASLRSYESAVPAIARILVTDLGLPLSPRLTVFVYPTHAAYAEGLAHIGRIRAEHAARIAGSAVGLAQHEALFIDDEALRGACAGTWLALIAHELTHAAQYELSGGRRARSEQWLREGMADWVAARVLDRLGMRDGRHRREDAYEVAFLLTDDLVGQHGFESVVAYFRAFATSDDRLGNFSRAFGVSLEAFTGAAFERLSGDLERGVLPKALPSHDRRVTNDLADLPGALRSPPCGSH